MEQLKELDMQTRIEVSEVSLEMALAAADKADAQFTGAPEDRRKHVMRAAIAAASTASDVAEVPMGEFLSDPAGSTMAALASEETSPEVAAIAARGLSDPASLTPAEITKVCGSALTHRPNR